MQPDKLEHIPLRVEKMFYELQERVICLLYTSDAADE